MLVAVKGLGVVLAGIASDCFFAAHMFIDIRRDIVDHVVDDDPAIVGFVVLCNFLGGVILQPPHVPTTIQQFSPFKNSSLPSIQPHRLPPVSCETHAPAPQRTLFSAATRACAGPTTQRQRQQRQSRRQSRRRQSPTSPLRASQTLSWRMMGTASANKASSATDFVALFVTAVAGLLIASYLLSEEQSKGTAR